VEHMGGTALRLSPALLACNRLWWKLERLARDKHSSLLSPFVSYKALRVRIHNTPSSSQLTKRNNKLECYITLCWKDQLGKNALAYWSLRKLRIRFQGCIHNTPHSSELTNGKIKLE
jgi:hypothetical protein